MLGLINEGALKVLFLIPYQDLIDLKELIHEVSIRTQVSPVFLDETLAMEGSILQNVRALVMSCDIIVTIITRSIPAELIFENEFIEFLNKPILIFARKPTIPFFYIKMQYLPLKYRITYYKDLCELKHLLVVSLTKLLLELRKPKYRSIKTEENELILILKKNLETNVLVLGKDSDIEGRKKIRRITDVLKNEGYTQYY